MVIRSLKIVLLLVVFVALAGGSAYLTLTLLIKGEDTVVVPDLLGKDIVYVLELLTDLGLNTKVRGSEYSDGVSKNKVIVQDPMPGHEIKTGRDVNIVLSKGARMIQMPNLRNLSIHQAGISLEDNGLEMGNLTLVYSDQLRKEEIITHDPLPGTMVKRGTRVNVLQSMGPRPHAYKMSDLKGLPINDAILMIERSELLLGQIKTTVNTRLAQDIVIKQEPVPGHQVLAGQAVNLVINKAVVSEGRPRVFNGGAVALFRHRLEPGFIKRHIRIRMDRQGLSSELFNDWLKPGEEVWVVVLRDDVATIFLYEDGELIETKVYD
jgi:serine/threonine-protein kinase